MKQAFLAYTSYARSQFEDVAGGLASGFKDRSRIQKVLFHPLLALPGLNNPTEKTSPIIKGN